MKFSKAIFSVIIGLAVFFPVLKAHALPIGNIEVNVVSSGDGLYADETEAGRYVYKGADPDNYIKLGGEMWRIVAVESNGDIKLVKDTFAANKQFDATEARTSGYCSFGDASTKGCNAWNQNNNFVNGSYHGEVSGNSQLNTYLNGEYYDSLNSTIKKYIVAYNWGVGPVTVNNTDLAGEVAGENAVTWNGNVALISHSDYMRANSNVSSCGNDKDTATNSAVCRTTNWLYVSGSFYWTLSPVGDSTNYVWVICGAGTISTYEAGSSYDVRPSIHITPDIDLNGSGTKDDPYTVDTPENEETVEPTPAQVVNVPSTFKSGPYIILLTGFALIIIAIIVILAVTKVKKAKKIK